MPTEIFLPILGESIANAVIARWNKQPGEAVKRGEVIAELETDKAVLDLECPENGILDAILAEAGETVTTGQRLAVLVRPGKSRAAQAPEKPTEQPALEPEQAQTQEPAAPSAPAPARAQRISPAARKMARELGIPLEDLRPSVPGARMTTEDVARFAAARTPGAGSGNWPSHRVALSAVRKLTARRMTESAQTVPQYAVQIDASADAFSRTLAAQREQMPSGGGKPTVTALLAFLVCRVLQRRPLVNARFDGNSIEVYEAVHLAVAARTPAGLVAPVIANAGALSFSQICNRLSDLAERARAGRLALDEVSNATFTLSNLGMFGITQFTPIINPPQAAILGVGAIRPISYPAPSGVLNGSVLTLTLTADHRVLDGADSAEFLSDLKHEIECCKSILSSLGE